MAEIECAYSFLLYIRDEILEERHKLVNF